jgi:hypothetical protein
VSFSASLFFSLSYLFEYSLICLLTHAFI